MDILVTELAKKELDKYYGKAEENQHLRVYMAGYSWAGPNLAMALDEPKESDQMMKVDDIVFLVDKDLAEALPGIKIDFVKFLFFKNFVISILNEEGAVNESTCG